MSVDIDGDGNVRIEDTYPGTGTDLTWNTVAAAGGTFETVSGTRRAAGGTMGLEVADQALNSSDFIVGATIDTYRAGVCGRVDTGTLSFYNATIVDDGGTDVARLNVIIGGSPSMIQQAALPGGSGLGSTVELEGDGDTLIVRVDGTEVISETDTSLSSGSTVGMLFERPDTSTLRQWDDFYAQDVAYDDGAPDPTFEHAWVGALGASSATVKASVQDASTVTVEVDTSDTFPDPDAFPATEGDDSVWSASLTGLSADTVHHWRVKVDGTVELTGQFSTFPSGAGNFTVAAASCALGSDGVDTKIADTSNSLSFAHIADRSPHLFLQLGDYGYFDHDADDVSLYRAGYRENLANARQQALYQVSAVDYVWDDHDYNGDDADADSPGREAAQQAYREHVPHYTLPDTESIEHTYVAGRVRFIILDTRSHRTDPGDPDGPSKTMLGADQKQWLKDTLAAATEPVIVVTTGVPWIGSGGAEDWSAYATERQELADYFHDNSLTDRLLLLHGDAHMIAMDDGTNSQYASGTSDPGPKVVCFAPLESDARIKGGPYSEGTFIDGATSGDGTGLMQYGVLDFADDGTTVTVTATGYSVSPVDGSESQVMQMVSTFSPAPAGTDTGLWMLVGGSKVAVARHMVTT